MSSSNHGAPAASLNPNVRGMEPSATLAINERSAALQAQGREVLRLGLGQSPFPVPAHVRDSLRSHAHEKDYLAVKGLPALRRSIVDWVRRREGLDYSPDHVLVGPGTKELLFLLQLAHDSELLLPSPSWVSYAPQARIIGRRTRWLPTRPEAGYALEAETLEEFCAREPSRSRLLILNTPCNPTGHCYEATQLEAIADVLRRYRVLALSDEIYSGTQFIGTHESLARYYPEGTIISNGLSKWCGAGGWRLGFFVFPAGLAWLTDSMAAVASETYTATSAPIQHAAVAALEEHTDMETYLAHSRSILAGLAAYAHRGLSRAGATLTPAAGGFYLFPRFEDRREPLASRGIEDGPSLCARLLEETGVALLPGSCFGRPVEELSLRLAYVDFDGARALEAAARRLVDEAFIKEHCGRVTTAIDRMADWIAA